MLPRPGSILEDSRRREGTAKLFQVPVYALQRFEVVLLEVADLVLELDARRWSFTRWCCHAHEHTNRCSRPSRWTSRRSIDVQSSYGRRFEPTIVDSRSRGRRFRATRTSESVPYVRVFASIRRGSPNGWEPCGRPSCILQPHRTETFTLSPDPLLVDKVRDIVGLYLNPPESPRGQRRRRLP